MWAFCFITCFMVLRSWDFMQKNYQQKIVVYNVPNHTAIDLIEGRNYTFIGDSILTTNGFLRNFHLKPSRILHRIKPQQSLNSFTIQQNLISCNGKSFLIIDKNFEPLPNTEKINIDAIVLTKNPLIHISKLYHTFNCKYYIFDSSNPFWKIAQWKKDADSLHLQSHSTVTDGAFVMNF